MISSGPGVVVYQPNRANVWAVASLLLAIVSFVPGIAFCAAPFGIIFGHIATAANRRDPTIGNRKMAKICLALNYLLLIGGLSIAAVLAALAL